MRKGTYHSEESASANTPGFQSCPKCDHETAPGVVICWWCGYCLDPRLIELAKAAKEVKP